MTFKNGKASFTVEIHEEEALKIDRLAKRQNTTFEKCVKHILHEALFSAGGLGPVTWEGIRELEARSATA